MASIGWIDFSTNDRNRVGSILDMLKPEGMVDELGLGTIRDGLANQLFPGISTIQTKAKYFFIIPYILFEYQALPPLKRRNKPAFIYLEEKEYEIMWNLAIKYNYVEGTGVIGITKRKPKKIARRPSAIYWNGLNTYQFINTQGLSAASYLKQASLSISDQLLSSVLQGDDAAGDDLDVDHQNAFNLRVAPTPDWQVDLSLDLSKDEAEFFKDRIISLAKHKLISELLQNEKLYNLFKPAKTTFADFAKVAVTIPISDILKSALILAHDFSVLMYGAHLAYNCMLHQRVFNSNHFDDEWDYWLQNINTHMIDYDNFDPILLLQFAATTKSSTSKFVTDWWHQTQAGFPDIVTRNQLIENQEATVKGGKARLRWKKVDDVIENKWIGLKHFDYRSNQARVILSDIKLGILN